MRRFSDRDRIGGDSTTNCPVVHLMVGLSRSGKSVWANEHRFDEDAVIVSRDDVRRAFGVEYLGELEPMVHTVADYALRAVLLRGQNVIIDETNLTRSERRRLLTLICTTCPGAKVVAVEVERPPDELLLKRCVEDSFPEDVMHAQCRKFTPVEEDEGFDEILHVAYRPDDPNQ